MFWKFVINLLPLKEFSFLPPILLAERSRYDEHSPPFLLLNG
jgi:hypothetical protein